VIVHPLQALAPPGTVKVLLAEIQRARGAPVPARQRAEGLQAARYRRREALLAADAGGDELVDGGGHLLGGMTRFEVVLKVRWGLSGAVRGVKGCVR